VQYRITSTIVRHQLSKQELLRLDGPVALPPDSIVEFPDGRIGCVVAARLILGGETTAQADLVIDVLL
jgi:hypothetical protein